MKKLVICGGGHASLPLLKAAAIFREKHGIETCLIHPGSYLFYSGTIPQYMAQYFEFSDTVIDLNRLCQKYGITRIDSYLKGVKADKNELVYSCDDGIKTMAYDYTVLNTGLKTTDLFSASESAKGDMPSPVTTNVSASIKTYRVKPLNELVLLREAIRRGEIRHLLIVGGGAAGSEIALNLSGSLVMQNMRISLIEADSRILSGFPEKLSRLVSEKLRDRGVELFTNTPFSWDTIWPDEAPEPAVRPDAVLLASGNQPSVSASQAGLPDVRGGRILTNSYLQIPSYPNIFVAGDTASVSGTNHSQIGVHAVKQGPVLRHNVLALHKKGDARRFQKYVPYPVQPLIISDGPDYGYMIAGPLVLPGRWAAVLKYMLDFNWLEKYRLDRSKRRSWNQLRKDAVGRGF